MKMHLNTILGFFYYLMILPGDGALKCDVFFLLILYIAMYGMTRGPDIGNQHPVGPPSDPTYET